VRSRSIWYVVRRSRNESRVAMFVSLRAVARICAGDIIEAA
jgi:hypothetical protein